MNKPIRYSPEVRERAVRMVLTGEHEYPSRWSATIESQTCYKFAYRQFGHRHLMLRTFASAA
ncbi:MAG: hypothetical protein HQM07_05935 [Zetaproteobacteria bacterium]|nr:hypothetical protein [Zetaproteobacteria bacterium]